MSKHKQQTTQWFSYLTPPKRKGRYECTCGEFHVFNGKDFRTKYGSLIAAGDPARWRGLTQKSKK